MNQGLIAKIRYTGVSQLALLATIFFSGSFLYDRNEISGGTFTFSDIIFIIVFIIISVLLFILTVLLNGEYYKTDEEELEAVIQKYKDNQ